MGEVLLQWRMLWTRLYFGLANYVAESEERLLVASRCGCDDNMNNAEETEGLIMAAQT